MKSYILFGKDNGKYAYEKTKADVCPGCGLVNRQTSRRNTFKRLKYDFSCTYDNETLISSDLYKKLIEIVSESNFEAAGNYYYILPAALVELDLDKQGARFGEACNICQTPSHIIGITPCYLREKISNSGIYASHFNFGDVKDYGSNLTPAIIVTADLLDVILELSPSGMHYEITQC